jgi:hypothetical protein
LRITSPGDFTLDAFDVVHKMEYPADDVKYDAIVLTGSGKCRICIAMTFRSDVVSQLLLHTKTLNGSTSWWTTPRTFHGRGQTPKLSVCPTLSLSVGEAFR